MTVLADRVSALQRATLVLGGLYDFSFAVAMLLAPDSIASAFAAAAAWTTLLPAATRGPADDAGQPLPGGGLRPAAAVGGALGRQRRAPRRGDRIRPCAMRDPALRSLWLMAGVDALFGIVHLVLARNTGVATTR